MPKPDIAKPTSYRVLVTNIQTELNNARGEMKKILTEKMTQTYVNVGEYIATELLENKERADYGKNLFHWLEEDLGIDATELHRMVKCYRLGLISGRGHQLSWRKIRVLLPVDNQAQREQLVKTALAKNLTQEALVNEVRALKSSDEEKMISSQKLKNSVGTLYAYPLKDVEGEGVLEVDLGFRVYRDADSKIVTASKPKDVVLVTKLKNGNYRMRTSTLKSEDAFTYAATLLKIVDGDTVTVQADLGFNTHSKQYLRLSQIDCPELKTQAGKRAKVFVENLLKDSKKLVIKTHGQDARGRWLADVMFLPGTSDPQEILKKGRFLNQEILDAGHAVVWSSSSEVKQRALQKTLIFLAVGLGTILSVGAVAFAHAIGF